MLMNDFLGDKVGRLGFGAMRLPVVDGDQARIDQGQLDAMVDEVMASGVNYFDTAWPYHGNRSEVALGQSLARYPRESFYLATYNDLQFQSSFTISMQMDAVPVGQRACDCIDCRACKALCPQGIDVPEMLSDLAGALEKMPKWEDLCREREKAAAAARGEQQR